MTDDLDTLSDDKLSAIFAKEVAGGHVESWMTMPPQPSLWHTAENFAKGDYTHGMPLNFATDANAVLPHLEKVAYTIYRDEEDDDARESVVHIKSAPSPGIVSTSFYRGTGRHKSLVRAIATALIRAHRK